MIKKSLLCTALCASLSIAALSGCTTASSSNKQKPVLHEDYEYSDKLSRANNIGRAFGFGFITETEAPEGMDFPEGGSVILDSAVWASNFHSAAGSSFLPGTSSWGSAIGWGIGIGLLSGALSGTDPRSESGIVGYLPAEAAKDSKEARYKMVTAFLESIQKSLKSQYPDAEFKIISDEYDSFSYKPRLEIKSAKLNCKFSEESNWYDPYNPCSITIWAYEPYKEPKLTTSMLGEQFSAWRFFAGGIALKFKGGNDLDQGLSWPKTMAASAPFLPEHMILYVSTLEGPRPKREKNPPFFVEKDKLDFFIIPDNPEALYRKLSLK